MLDGTAAPTDSHRFRPALGDRGRAGALRPIRRRGHRRRTSADHHGGRVRLRCARCPSDAAAKARPGPQWSIAPTCPRGRWSDRGGAAQAGRRRIRPDRAGGAAPPYVDHYFEALPDIWATRTMENARTLAAGLYPRDSFRPKSRTNRRVPRRRRTHRLLRRPRRVAADVAARWRPKHAIGAEPSRTSTGGPADARRSRHHAGRAAGLTDTWLRPWHPEDRSICLPWPGRGNPITPPAAV